MIIMKNYECKIRQIQMKSWTKIRKTISKQYWKYEKLFTKSSENQTLSEYKSWDHKISLIKKIISKKLSIYQLSFEELQELRNYLNNNLQRKYIWYFINEIRYSVIFVSKKDEKQQLCIDYQKLNKIIWKNRYLLSLIKKLQEWLKKIK